VIEFRDDELELYEVILDGVVIDCRAPITEVDESVSVHDSAQAA
jgi:hypothetical protein